MGTIEYEELENEHDEYSYDDWWGWDSYDYRYYDPDYNNKGPAIIYQGITRTICGTRYDCDRFPMMDLTTTLEPAFEGECFDRLNGTNCGYLCATEAYDADDMAYAYYIADVNECYCETYTQKYYNRKCFGNTK